MTKAPRRPGGSAARRKREAAARPATFPAISLRQPWADFVLAGMKDVENRKWPTRFRGTILIHAAQRVEWKAAEEFAAALGLDWLRDYDPNTGALLGLVDITDCVTRHRSDWFLGPYGFVLRNPVRFRKPIPYRGSLGIFQVPVSLLRGTAAARAKGGSFTGR